MFIAKYHVLKKYFARSNYEVLAAKRVSEKKDRARLVQKDYSSEDEKWTDRAKYFNYIKMISKNIRLGKIRRLVKFENNFTR